MQAYTTRGTPLALAAPIGSGREGTVYTITNTPRHVAKLYHEPNSETTAKIRTMISNSPVAARTNPPTVCWPIDLLYNVHGAAVGCMLPRLHNTVTLAQLRTATGRSASAPGTTWEFLLAAGHNTASAIAALHQEGYVVGDIAGPNILVHKTATITLIDTDSIQVPQPNGGVFRCHMAGAGYLPPELEDENLRTVDRTTAHDHFALAVLLYRLLLEDTHPHSGARHGNGAPTSPAGTIENGHSANTTGSPVTPRPDAVPSSILPTCLQELARQCFITAHHNPTQRPTAKDWARALSQARHQLTRCHKNPTHVYSTHLERCPWCKHAKTSGSDLYPNPHEISPQRPRGRPERHEHIQPPTWEESAAQDTALSPVGTGREPLASAWRNA